MRQAIQTRREIEAALRDREQNQQFYFENTTDAIYTVDRDFRITSISPSVEHILGFKPDELIGKNFQEIDIVSPDYLEKAVTETL